MSNNEQTPRRQSLDLDESNALHIGCPECAELGMPQDLAVAVAVAIGQIVVVCNRHDNRPPLVALGLDITAYRWAVQKWMANNQTEILKVRAMPKISSVPS